MEFQRFCQTVVLDPIDHLNIKMSEIWLSSHKDMHLFSMQVVPLQPDGCNLSVLLTFSYVEEKSNFSCLRM